MSKLPKEELKRIKKEASYNFIAILLIFAFIGITCLLNC